MKIYYNFNLQNHTFLLHEISKNFQKRGFCKDFAGMLAIKNGRHYDYLKKQTEVAYHHLDVMEELEHQALQSDVSVEKVKLWEQRLQGPLWHLAVADRHIGHAYVKGACLARSEMMEQASHDNIIRLVCYFLDFYEKRLREYQPNAVICLGVASLPSLALLKVCEYLAIPFYTLVSTRVHNRYLITCNEGSSQCFHEVRKKYQHALEKENQSVLAEAKDYLASFQEEQPPTPDYYVFNTTGNKKIQQKGLVKLGLEQSLALAGALKKKCFPPKNTYLRNPDPLQQWWLDCQRTFTVRKGKLPEMEPANKMTEEPYIFFPLHHNPEMSTMILAPNFVNQEALVEAVSKNIPFTHKLYVKEHKPMIGRRTREFYQKLKQYPNVRLIEPQENTFALIRNADLVMAITGTVGWEAILMGKPVITFSNKTFYANLGFSEKCTDLTQLYSIVCRVLKNPSSLSPQQRQQRLELFLSTLFANSFSVIPDVNRKTNLSPETLTEQEHESIDLLASQFIQAIEDPTPALQQPLSSVSN